MKYSADITIMPHDELLDPEGKTVQKNLPHVGINHVNKVRIGKHIKMDFEAENKEAAEELVEKACKKILANVIMESYSYSITEA